MYAFHFHRATSTADAVHTLRGGDDSRFLAGGQTLLASLKLRLAQPDRLIDLAALAELRGIEDRAGLLRIGAMTTHAEVASDPRVRAANPALADLAGGIGDPMVRHAGTLGGSLANADPAACYPAAVLGLGATVVTTERRIAADEFFVGLFETALRPGELILAVEFRRPQRAAYLKFKHPASRFALVGVFVAQTDRSVRLAVTGAGARVFRLPEAEQRLLARFSPDALDGLSVRSDGFNSDLQASATYRAHLVGVLARRAVAMANARTAAGAQP